MHILSVFWHLVLFRDQALTDIIPLYKTMKKSTFSDSEEEVGLLMYYYILIVYFFIYTVHIQRIVVGFPEPTMLRNTVICASSYCM